MSWEHTTYRVSVDVGCDGERFTSDAQLDDALFSKLSEGRREAIAEALEELAQRLREHGT